MAGVKQVSTRVLLGVRNQPVSFPRPSSSQTRPGLTLAVETQRFPLIHHKTGAERFGEILPDFRYNGDSREHSS